MTTVRNHGTYAIGRKVPCKVEWTHKGVFFSRKEAKHKAKELYGSKGRVLDMGKGAK